MESNQPKKLLKMGRPPKEEGEKAVKKTVSLSPATYHYLVEVGGGILSNGVERSAEFHKRYAIKANKQTD